MLSRANSPSKASTKAATRLSWPALLAQYQQASYWNEQLRLFTPRDIALAVAALAVVVAEVVSGGPFFLPLLPVFLLAIGALLYWNSLDIRPPIRRALLACFVIAVGSGAAISPALAQITAPEVSCSTGILGPLATYMQQIVVAITQDTEFAGYSCLIFQAIAVFVVVAIVGSLLYLIIQSQNGAEVRMAAAPLFMTIIFVLGVGLASRAVLGV